METVEQIRIVEALIFASDKPLSSIALADCLPEGARIDDLLTDLQAQYEKRGVNLVEVAGKWMFQTAPDLAFLLRKEVEEEKRLSRAAVETLAIISYHQPVTRAEIEEVRGVSLSKGILDVLMAAQWVRPMGRRRTPGRPMSYGTTDHFLVHFGLNTIKDLPGLAELKAAGFLENVNTSRLNLMDDEKPSEEQHELPGYEDGDQTENQPLSD
ncbi:SMC-Scp complex subunit ScpB [Paremcibacter congregatus]|uniref:SMC-Scp complex subunit ScpB n=1 Tax=Paremcibacter congregatus TaxID=2043170 RepID=A0A2G4YN07_9PROT|nr:SMC-Scp complex subunit ScpB [Paremcibacter congregatus]PHZ83691.1 SMC-Scp complex subunit ScpB [Paremcibacter congregatus]QDE27394.1 SMC-Scp complex subunit ScpB [Paremcibacter congregatus]